MLIDPDGTRHYLGSGSYYTTAEYQTNDGTHIRFIGNANVGEGWFTTTAPRFKSAW
jgi:hypothetical protein